MLSQLHYIIVSVNFGTLASSLTFFVIPCARHLLLAPSPHGPFLGGRGPLKHLCNLEVGYGGDWAPNFGGVAPGFEPRTSCLRVRSATITLRDFCNLK